MKLNSKSDSEPGLARIPVNRKGALSITATRIPRAAVKTATKVNAADLENMRPAWPASRSSCLLSNGSKGMDYIRAMLEKAPISHSGIRLTTQGVFQEIMVEIRIENLGVNPLFSIHVNFWVKRCSEADTLGFISLGVRH